MLPVRMLNEYVYCPRLFYLEYVQGLFRESTDTVHGKFQHDRSESDRPKVRHKSKETAPEQEETPSLFTKSLSLTSEKLGITGKLDAVEEENGHYAPVDMKHSSGPDGKTEFTFDKWKLAPYAWPNDQIQVCAQGLLLRDNGFNSDYAFLYYRSSKERVKVDFTNDLINTTRDIIEKAEAASKNPIPAPLVDSPKCIRCSLNAFCLPDEINQLAGKIGEPRRIIPGRDDAGVLYVITQGARVSKTGESLIISANGEKIDQIPLKDISHVVLVGHIQITTETLHILMLSGRTISFCSAGGRLIGTASAPIAKNVGLRLAQYRTFDIPVSCLKLAKEIVAAKIENQRTILRRNGDGCDNSLEELKKLAQNCVETENIASLRGHEGKAGQVYFDTFPSLIGKKTVSKSSQQTFDDLEGGTGWSSVSESFFAMNGRNKRPPRDPANAMLSFGYTLLARDFVSTLVGVGLDPYFGFYHSLEAGRPALALDLMEPFRPVVVDSMVLRLINTGEIKPAHFHCAKMEVQMTKEGRAKFINAYERRMDELVSHPVFGYRISYRRILDVECRLLGRFLAGEIGEYKPLRTR